MTPNEPYTTEEEHAVEDACRRGESARCPRCDVPLDRRAVRPRTDVSYVRDRILFSCPRCHRTAAVDVKAWRA